MAIPDNELANAQNAATTSADLMTLARDTADPQVLEAIAAHPNANHAALMAVVYNATATQTALRAVADNVHADPAILTAIAAHPNANLALDNRGPRG